MQVTVQTDPESKKVLAVYFQIAEGKVHKTVPIDEGKCYVDEDRRGKILGVEMLSPGELKILVQSVARKYRVPGLTSQVRRVAKALAV